MSDSTSLSGMPTDFGKRIKAARKHAGLTQVELSKAIDIKQSSLSHLENTAFCSTHTTQIAKACKVDPNWLATGEGEMLLPTEDVGGSSVVTTLSTRAPRGLAVLLVELQAIIKGLSPLLQDAACVVLTKWLNGQANLDDVVATIESMQKINTGSNPGAEKRLVA